MSRPLALATLVLALFAAPAGAISLPADATRILTGAPDGLTALAAPVAGSSLGSVSDDGRFVAFTSDADGLSAEDRDDVTNVFVKDRTTGEVTLVSRATGAAGAATTSDCAGAAISGNGARVAFQCRDGLGGGTPGSGSTYVRDRGANTTTLVSRASGAAGAPGGANLFGQVAISRTGDDVAFLADADLDPTVSVTGSSGLSVYRRRISTATTTLVSRKTGAGTALPGSPFGLDISDDGDTVAFATTAVLASTPEVDANSAVDVYLRRISTSTTRLASAEDTGPTYTAGNDQSDSPALSGNGDVVAFVSRATNLDSRDATGEQNGYRHTFSSRATNLLDLQPGGTKTTGTTSSVDLDETGARSVVASTTAELVAGAGGDDFNHVYRRGPGAGEAALIGRRTGAAGEQVPSYRPRISRDGSTVAFEANGATADADPLLQGVFTRAGDATTLVSRPAGTAPFADAVGSARTDGGGDVSADGRYVAYRVRVPEPRYEAIAVQDTLTGATELASRENGPGGALTRQPDGYRLSADGRHLVFVAYDVVAGYRVLLRDLDADTTTLVSRANGAAGVAATGTNTTASVSADGSRVAWISAATDLGDGDTDAEPDVHVRDLAAGTTTLVSRATGAAGAKANAGSFSAAISADGRHVVFATTATNLGDGDTDTRQDVHVRDLGAGSTVLASRADGADGAKASADSRGAAISADGSRVAFVTDGVDSLRVRDLVSGRTLESAGDSLTGTGAHAEAVTIDPSGTVVAYERTTGGFLSASVSQIERVVVGESTGTLMSRRDGVAGAPGDGFARGPSLTDRGACVTFSDRATLAGGSPDQTQVFVRAVASDCGRGGVVAPPAAGAGTGGAGTGPSAPGVRRDTTRPRVTRATLSRKRFKPGKGKRRGSVLRFRLSERARTTLTVHRRVTVKRGKRRVVRFKRVGTIRIKAHKRGTVNLRLSGKVGRKTLRGGRYRLTLVATDTAGNRSRPARLFFTVRR